MVATIEVIAAQSPLDLSDKGALKTYSLEQESAKDGERSDPGCYSTGCYSASGCVDCYSTD